MHEVEERDRARVVKWRTARRMMYTAAVVAGVGAVATNVESGRINVGWPDDLSVFFYAGPLASVTINNNIEDESPITNIFEMDYSAGAFPEAGFDSYADTTTYCYTLQRIASGGPGDRPYYRFFNHDSASTTAGCNEPYMGGWDVVTDAGFENGDTFYVRGRHRLEEGADCSSNGDQHGGKYFMHNDGGDSDNTRVMMSTECWEGSNSANRLALGIMRSNGDQRCYVSTGGAVTGYTDENFAFLHDDGVWIDWQMRIIFSSSDGVNDGEFALWVDGDNSDEGSPSCVVNTTTMTASVFRNDVPVDIGTGNPNRFGLGYYYNYPADQTGGDSAIHNLADFEISRSFDATWGN